MTADLVSRLTETLDELERVARAAIPGPWRYRPMKVWHGPPRPGDLHPQGEEFVGAGPLDAPVCVAATGPADDPQSMADARHIARWDPQAVLRLVEAYRAAIVAYSEAREHAARLLRGRAHGATVLEADGVARGLRIALENLAAAFGITEEPSDG